MEKDVFERMRVRSKGYEALRADMDLFIKDLMERNKELSARLAAYSEAEEVKKLKEKVEYYQRHSLHVLTDKEYKDAQAFREYHWDVCKGNTAYILSGTGVGTAVAIKCTKCGKEENITEYDNW